MSATIDVDVLAGKLAELGAPTPVAKIAVPGANYFVQRYFFQTKSPFALGASVRASPLARTSLCLGGPDSGATGVVHCAADALGDILVARVAGPDGAKSYYRAEELQPAEPPTPSACLSLSKELMLEAPLTWDPDADDALDALVDHVLRIYKFDTAEYEGGDAGPGNMLVFVPDARFAVEGALKLSEKLPAASSVVVLPFHSRLNKSEQAKVTEFPKDYPKGTRMICFSVRGELAPSAFPYCLALYPPSPFSRRRTSQRRA